MSKIRDRRVELALTQQEVALLVGISRQAYSAIESLAAAPKVDVALRIARVLCSSVEVLFGSTESSIQRDGVELSRYVVADLGGKRSLIKLPNLSQGIQMSADILGYQRGERVTEVSSSGWESVIYTGCDPIVSVLSQYMVRYGGKVHHRWLNKPNYDSLSDLKERKTHFAVVHHSQESQVMNVHGFESIPLSEWELVLAFRPGFTATSLVDLVGSDVVFAGRPVGSGVYDFMASQVASLVTNPIEAFGRYITCKDHEQVATQLAQGSADAGVTSLSAAMSCGVPFVEVDLQRSVLLYDKEVVDERLVTKVGGEVCSRRFRLEVQAISGYRLS